MATAYPKCSPTEMMGLLVLVNSHKGSEDVALLADDLDLEIDEILPSVDYAEVLGFVKVADGRVTLSDLGRKFLAASIRDRKAVLREQLRRTTLFRTLLQALDNAPERQLNDEQLGEILAMSQAPIDEAVQNIVNWGRYAELFRYDSEEGRLVAIRRPSSRTGGGSGRPPSPGASKTAASSGSARPTTEPAEVETRAALVAST